MLTASEAQAKIEEREANIVKFAVSTPNPSWLNALPYIFHMLPTTNIIRSNSNDISTNATPHPEVSMFVFVIPVTCEDAYPREL